MDHIVVGSDSGRIVVLKYNGETNQFDKVHQETFGKSGCRRIEPGQYLAVDPRGRALMLGAIEKKKLVYAWSWVVLEHCPSLTAPPAAVT